MNSVAFASLKTLVVVKEESAAAAASACKKRSGKRKTENLVTDKGRRGLLLAAMAATAAALTQPNNDSRTQLLNKYLKKSEQNKAKNDKERLDDYYKRNYKDYFGLLEGDLKQRKELSESEKGILEWLEKNK